MSNGTSSEDRLKANRWPAVTVAVALILATYWAALFYGTHVRLPPGVLPGNSDKVIHFFSYAGLATLLLSLRATRGQFPWISVIGRWVCLAVYGAFDELTQALVNRSPDLHDWYADICGVTLGLGLVTFVYWCLRKSSKTATLSPTSAQGT